MADNRTIEQRKYCMQQIKGKDTTPEMIVRKYLHRNGFRYSLHNKNLFGKPDLTLKRYKTVVFINGCFWHGHDNCKYAKTPKSNKSFWIDKIRRNKERDYNNRYNLENLGWNVIVLWECQLKKEMQDTILSNLYKKLQQNLDIQENILSSS